MAFFAVLFSWVYMIYYSCSSILRVCKSWIVWPFSSHHNNVIQTHRYIRIESKNHVSPVCARRQMHCYGCLMMNCQNQSMGKLENHIYLTKVHPCSAGCTVWYWSISSQWCSVFVYHLHLSKTSLQIYVFLHILVSSMKTAQQMFLFRLSLSCVSFTSFENWTLHLYDISPVYVNVSTINKNFTEQQSSAEVLSKPVNLCL